MPANPVLIVNPRSGDGRAGAVDLVHIARQRGLETVSLQAGEDLAGLATHLVDQGGDHLMMAGGDGSLAIVAEVAMARDIPFSCVPVGTRNHFAMDLGLDRADPLQSLEAAFDGSERLIDVGIAAGQVFLNNVSFGLYPRAIADPEYRSHRARSMADAAVATASHPEARISAFVPDGRGVGDVEVLLASNNPYRFIGPPDFARRPALDTGTLGIILMDRRSRLKRGPAAFTRWETRELTVDGDPPTIRVGIDGELRELHPPLEVSIAPRALRVLVPSELRSRSLRDEIEQINARAIAYVGGLPALPSQEDEESGSSLLRRLDEIDQTLFQRIAEWHSPALDRLMPALSQAASHSKIWMAMAAAIWLTGGRKGRQVAVEGLTAVAITSLLANLVAKGLIRRPRPADRVPEARRLPTPGSSSMPSGHAASAAAFSSVVGRAYPSLRIPLDAIAAAVGFSRVYTGVHHPSDVAAGWLLGRGIGTLAHTTTTTVARLRRATARVRAGGMRRP